MAVSDPSNDASNSAIDNASAGKIVSMTGFGSAEWAHEHGTLNWTLRSVNQRYLDCSWRLPESFTELEAECRELLGQAIKRGKVDAILRYEPQQSQANFVVNRSLVDALTQAAEQIADRAAVTSNPLNTIDLMQWPGVLQARALSESASELLQDYALRTFEHAVQNLKETRLAEGQRIAALFDARLESMANVVAQVRQMQPAIRTHLEQKLRQRLADLAVEVALDEGRIEQELILHLHKADVAEELDRLDAHINAFDQTLLLNEPIGQRLNFLCQEMNREANTLGAKSQGLAQTNAAIELKVLIEQIREQVANVE